MRRASAWILCIAACASLVAGCGGDDTSLASESARDSIGVQSPAVTQRDSDLDAATVAGAARAGTTGPATDHRAALWQAITVYERIAASGGWPQLPDDARLRIGDSGPGVAVLRRRLAATGDLRRSLRDRFSRGSSLFDAQTEAALRRFQERHGLEPDGVVGPQTRAALDIPAAERARQLRANLWRAQAAPALGAGRAIVVNIPDYHLTGYEGGRPVVDMRVVVGTTDDPTPSFSARMTYVVFRPYWVIPTRIAVEEVVPQIQRDPRVLKRKNLEVVVAGAMDSVLADSATIDWSRFERSGYMLRRRPGGRNPLGDVKFMFPNPYSVYLHDTPQDNLFLKDDRTFSHGCVRVEKPVDLAEFVLRGTSGWDRDRISHAMWVGETQTVHLPEPIPTHLVYWTAWVDDDGRVQFRDDIYHQDGATGEDVVAVP